MSCSLSIQIPKALPPLSLIQSRFSSLPIVSKQKQPPSSKPKKTLAGNSRKPIDSFPPQKTSLAVQVGALLATVAQPAFAVTGVNHEEDFIWVLIQLGIAAFWYFLIMPPIIMNWLRIRWYRRNLLEMYLQFMFVFMFFPGVLLWAPFLNFRRFPRDPNMEYPWSTPQDPSQIKTTYLKYPWGKIEDYE
ncbi:NAD(P)H-quinone oxidoreductase subunit L, chloroplastic [Cornus florida]|uniref:NAD(P)H-quinone oxidoreductase subunit L, chloroplastic n=1 Tax=Cornus florida TaxID=4283 RepID=UPI0028A18D58|nr:NAD(P)H-quinone oxidoreductase subunit L, chloroplastic [Cornus florida]